MDRGALWATVYGVTKSDTTEDTHTTAVYCPRLFCSLINVRCALSVHSPWISSLTSMMSLLHFFLPLGLILCSRFSKAHLLLLISSISVVSIMMNCFVSKKSLSVLGSLLNFWAVIQLFVVHLCLDVPMTSQPAQHHLHYLYPQPYPRWTCFSSTSPWVIRTKAWTSFLVSPRPYNHSQIL